MADGQQLGKKIRAVDLADPQEGIELPAFRQQAFERGREVGKFPDPLRDRHGQGYRFPAIVGRVDEAVGPILAGLQYTGELALLINVGEFHLGVFDSATLGGSVKAKEEEA